MTQTSLKAALYLDAVLPGLAHLAPLDRPLRTAAAGPSTFAITLAVRDIGMRRLNFARDGSITTATVAQPGDLRLWFPSASQFLRTVTNRLALALPTSGWRQLAQVKRFTAAGARLDELLTTRATRHLDLHAWGSLLIGLAATASWLRRHPGELEAFPARGLAVFACPDFPQPLWLDLTRLTTGTGEPSAPVSVRITFADLATVIAELDNQLDAPAALGLGTLRIEGHLPLAENLGIVMLKAGNLLKPPHH